MGGAYALWALPEATLREVEAHLTSCPNHSPIAGLRAVAFGMALAAPEREPPPTLKARLMESIQRGAAREAEGEHRDVSARRRMVWAPRPLAPYALAAALAVAVAGLLAWNLALQTSDDSGKSATIVRTLTNGGSAGGRVLLLADQGLAVITVDGLAPLPAEKAYQVWAISKGEPTGIGLFNASESGEASAVLRADLSRVEAIAITIEPATGSPQPTTAPVLSAEI